MIKFGLLFLASVFFANATQAQGRICSQIARGLRVGSLNVENLLNPARTRGENLIRPTGYNQAVVADKLERASMTLGDVTADGGRPDIMIAVEIHDEDVASQLAHALGFNHMKMTRSRDERGMDVAIFWNDSNLVRGATYIDELIFRNPKFQIDPTRNVLLIEFDVAGQKFVTLANHWPSLMNPPEMRAEAASETRQVMAFQLSRAAQMGYEVTVAAGGDFNTIDTDLLPDGSTPFKDYLLNPRPGQTGPIFVDAQLELSAQAQAKMPPASYYYKGDKNGQGAGWNRLDRFAIGRTPNSLIIPRRDGFKIHIPSGDGARPLEGSQWPIPNRYFFRWVEGPRNPEGTLLQASGRSDHFMVTQDFDLVTAPAP